MQIPFYVVGRSLPPSAAHMLLVKYKRIRIGSYSNNLLIMPQYLSTTQSKLKHLILTISCIIIIIYTAETIG